MNKNLPPAIPINLLTTYFLSNIGIGAENESLGKAIGKRFAIRPSDIFVNIHVNSKKRRSKTLSASVSLRTYDVSSRPLLQQAESSTETGTPIIIQPFGRLYWRKKKDPPCTIQTLQADITHLKISHEKRIKHLEKIVEELVAEIKRSRK